MDLPDPTCNVGTMKAHSHFPEMTESGEVTPEHMHVPEVSSGTCVTPHD